MVLMIISPADVKGIISSAVQDTYQTSPLSKGSNSDSSSIIPLNANCYKKRITVL